jgi:hypothetical protein
MNYKWSHKGANIRSPELLGKIRAVLDKGDPVLVRHWFLGGARVPEHKAFDRYDDFIAWLDAEARPGDAIDLWNIHEFVEIHHSTKLLARGKQPNEDGETPEGGAY